MDVRGRLQEGMVADITIFDPETVTDNASYKAGEQGRPTTGISYVIVNGKPVVEKAVFKKVWAGQPIRFDAADKGRFDGVDRTRFLKNITVPTISVEEAGAAANAHL